MGFESFRDSIIAAIMSEYCLVITTSHAFPHTKYLVVFLYYRKITEGDFAIQVGKHFRRK